MRNKKRSTLKSPEDKDARALVMQLERVKGLTITEIARSYNCSVPTVEKYLARARSRGLITNQARTLLEDKLLPLALAVIEANLLDGSLEAAQDVLYGLGILQKNSTIKHQQGDPEDTLEAYREQYLAQKATAAIDVAPVASPAPLPQRPPEVTLGPGNGIVATGLDSPAPPDVGDTLPPGFSRLSPPDVQDYPSLRWVTDLQPQGDQDGDE